MFLIIIVINSINIVIKNFPNTKNCTSNIDRLDLNCDQCLRYVMLDFWCQALINVVKFLSCIY